MKGDRATRVDTAFLVLGCAIAVAIAVWLTWGIWQPGLPNGGDSAAHAVRVEDSLTWLFPRFELDGWQSSFGLGYQQSLFMGPGFTVIVTLVRVLSLGLLSPIDALKVTVVASFAAVPIGTAFMALSFGLGRRAAGIAAVLSLVVSSQFGGAGIAGTFEIGLLPNQAASLFVLLSFGGMVRILRQPSTRRVVGTALATAAVILTHPVATAILTFLAVSLLLAAAIEWIIRRPRQAWATTRWTLATGMDPEGYQAATLAQRAPDVLPRVRDRVVALAATALLTGGLAAAQLLPLVAHRDLAGASATWIDPDLRLRLLDMWHGDFLFRPGVFALVLAGFAFAVGRGRRQTLALTLVLTPIVFLLLGRVFITLFPDNGVAIQLTNRSFAYIGLLAVLPLSMLLAWLTNIVSVATARILTAPRDPLPDGAARAAELTGGAIAVGLAMAIVLLPAHLNRDHVGTQQPTTTFAHAADQIRALVPDGARFVTVRMPGDEPPLTGLTHPDFWIVWATGRDSLNIFNIESSSVIDSLFASEPVNDADPNSSDPALRADILSRLGITHVLVINTAKATKVAGSPRLRPVWQEGSMVIYEVVAAEGQPAPAAAITATPGPIQATMRRDDPEHLHFTVTASAPATATAAVAWSPKWQASLNGQPVTFGRTADGLVSIAVPAGETTLDLTYGSDRYDAIGRAISLVSLGLAIWLLVRDRRRRRGASIPPAGDVNLDPDADVDPDEVLDRVSDRGDDREGVRRGDPAGELLSPRPG